MDGSYCSFMISLSLYNSPISPLVHFLSPIKKDQNLSTLLLYSLLSDLCFIVLMMLILTLCNRLLWSLRVIIE